MENIISFFSLFRSDPLCLWRKPILDSGKRKSLVVEHFWGCYLPSRWGELGALEQFDCSCEYT